MKGAWFCLLLWPLGVWADTLAVHSVVADFRWVRESVIESIEAEGFVPGVPLAFGDMLARTSNALNGLDSPLAQAEILPFCSARLALAMVEEAAGQIAHCPLTIAVYERRDQPGVVWLSHRRSEGNSPARQSADAVLRQIVERALSLAR